MNLKPLASFVFFVVTCVVGFLVLGSRCTVSNPADALAGFLMLGAHCSDVPLAVSTAPARSERQAVSVTPQLRIVDQNGEEIGTIDFTNKLVLANVFVAPGAR